MPTSEQTVYEMVLRARNEAGAVLANYAQQAQSATATILDQFKQIDAASGKTFADYRKAVGDAVPVLGQLDQQTTDFLATLKQLPPSAGIAGLAIAGIALEAKAATAAIKELDAASSRLGVLTNAEGRLGGIRGSTAEFRALQERADNGLTLYEAARLSNQASTRGLDAQTLREIVETGNEVSAVLGQDLLPTIEQLNQAVGIGTVRAFAAAGANVRELERDFGSGRLSIEETREVLRRLREDLDGDGDSVADSFESTRKAVADVKNELGQTWAENPLIVAGAKAQAAVVDFMRDKYIDYLRAVREAYVQMQELFGLRPPSTAAERTASADKGRVNVGNGYWSQGPDGNRVWVSTAAGESAPGAVSDWVFVDGEWVRNTTQYTGGGGGRSGSGGAGGGGSRRPSVALPDDFSPTARALAGIINTIRGTVGANRRDLQGTLGRLGAIELDQRNLTFSASPTYQQQQLADLLGSLPAIPPPPPTAQMERDLRTRQALEEAFQARGLDIGTRTDLQARRKLDAKGRSDQLQDQLTQAGTSLALAAVAGDRQGVASAVGAGVSAGIESIKALGDAAGPLGAIVGSLAAQFLGKEIARREKDPLEIQDVRIREFAPDLELRLANLVTAQQLGATNLGATRGLRAAASLG